MPDFTPGIFEDMTNRNYQSILALSKTGIGSLLDECPAKFWSKSPLNPQFEPENKSEFDVGNACHLIFLEPHLVEKKISIVRGFTKDGKESKGYTSEDAKAKRQWAWDNDKIPLLPEQFEIVHNMHKVLMDHPIAKDAFKNGRSENSHFWIDPITGVQCKARPDFESSDGSYVVDYKTTFSAHPRDFSKRVWDMKYFVQHPWYLDGIEMTTGKRPKNFLFVVQETKAPYLVSVFQLSQTAIEHGKMYIAKAKEVYRKCLDDKQWPGYRDAGHPNIDRVMTVDLPTYAEYQLADREVSGEFNIQGKTPNFAQPKHRAAFEMDAPREIL